MPSSGRWWTLRQRLGRRARSGRTRRSAIRIALEREFAFVRLHVERIQERIGSLREARPETPPDDLFALEVQLTELNTDLDKLIEAATEDIERAAVVGVDLGPDVALLDQRLEDRAATLAARIELIVDRRTTLLDRIGRAGADTVAIREELNALEEKLRGTTTSLQAMVDLMGERDLETAGLPETAPRVDRRPGDGGARRRGGRWPGGRPVGLGARLAQGPLHRAPAQGSHHSLRPVHFRDPGPAGPAARQQGSLRLSGRDHRAASPAPGGYGLEAHVADRLPGRALRIRYQRGADAGGARNRRLRARFRPAGHALQLRGRPDDHVLPTV